MPWYLYTPIGSSPYNPLDPNNYTLVGMSPPSCPSPNLNLCAIQSSGNTLPNISPSMCQDLIFALSNRVDTFNVLLKP